MSEKQVNNKCEVKNNICPVCGQPAGVFAAPTIQDGDTYYCMECYYYKDKDNRKKEKK